tara:strand:- start:76 stop:1308 length:1233 start_codon:yes stop_codon:yes gene_type:complete
MTSIVSAPTTTPTSDVQEIDNMRKVLNEFNVERSKIEDYGRYNDKRSLMLYFLDGNMEEYDEIVRSDKNNEIDRAFDVQKKMDDFLKNNYNLKGTTWDIDSRELMSSRYMTKKGLQTSIDNPTTPQNVLLSEKPQKKYFKIDPNVSKYYYILDTMSNMVFELFVTEKTNASNIPEDYDKDARFNDLELLLVWKEVDDNDMRLLLGEYAPCDSRVIINGYLPTYKEFFERFQLVDSAKHAPPFTERNINEFEKYWKMYLGQNNTKDIRREDSSSRSYNSSSDSDEELFKYKKLDNNNNVPRKKKKQEDRWDKYERVKKESQDRKAKLALEQLEKKRQKSELNNNVGSDGGKKGEKRSEKPRALGGRPPKRKTVIDLVSSDDEGTETNPIVIDNSDSDDDVTMELALQQLKF